MKMLASLLGVGLALAMRTTYAKAPGPGPEQPSIAEAPARGQGRAPLMSGGGGGGSANGRLGTGCAWDDDGYDATCTGCHGRVSGHHRVRPEGMTVERDWRGPRPSRAQHGGDQVDRPDSGAAPGRGDQYMERLEDSRRHAIDRMITRRGRWGRTLSSRCGSSRLRWAAADGNRGLRHGGRCLVCAGQPCPRRPRPRTPLERGGPGAAAGPAAGTRRPGAAGPGRDEPGG